MHHRKILAAACAICAAAIAALTPCPRVFSQIPGADTTRFITVWGYDARRRARALVPDTANAKTYVDRVVATVEDRAIMQSDVENEIKNFMVQTQRTSLPPDEEKTLREEALNSLIATALLTIQADRDNLRVEDKELEAAIERWIEQKKTEIGGG